MVTRYNTFSVREISQGMGLPSSSGFYCTGWVRRGAVGAFSSNLDDQYETANSVVEDLENGMQFSLAHENS